MILPVVAIAAAAALAGSASAATAPSAPMNVKALATNGQARVWWSAPASDGGSPVTEYIVTASGGGGQKCYWTTGPLTCLVTGLFNGIEYTFTVTATNGIGTGPQSSLSNVVSGVGPPPPPDTVTATAGTGQATVSCNTESNGGSTITSYTATASPGGAHASAPTCRITVTGLTEGATYTFTVTATNGFGTSAPSTASSPLTLGDTQPPTAPSGVTGRLAGSSLVLTWSASTDDVGVTAYEIQLNGAAIANAATTTATVRASGGVYTVTALDAAGNRSPASAPVTLRARPMPKGVPRTVPGWARKLLAWEMHHNGVRPKTPTPLPKWYAAWKQWRTAPFAIGS